MFVLGTSLLLDYIFQTALSAYVLNEAHDEPVKKMHLCASLIYQPCTSGGAKALKTICTTPGGQGRCEHENQVTLNQRLWCTYLATASFTKTTQLLMAIFFTDSPCVSFRR
jgi:hypothetical protein